MPEDIASWIEEQLYTKIKAVIPIPCVDLLIVYHGNLLLMLRRNKPGKGIWFTPGGRILRGETIMEAVKRILQKETGLTPNKITKIGVMEHIWPETHTITVFHRVDVANKNVIMNSEHSDYKWVESIPENTHPFLLEMIRESRIFQQ